MLAEPVFVRMLYLPVFVLLAIGAIVILWLLLRNPATRWLGVTLVVTPLTLVFLALLVVILASKPPGEPGASAPGYVGVPLDAEQRIGPARGLSGGSRPRLADSHLADAKNAPKIASPASSQPPAKRPEWIESKPRPVEGGYQFAVAAGPYESEVECQRELPAKFQEAFDDYVELMKLQFGVQTSQRFDLPAELRDAAQHDFYRETLHSSVGPMQQLHVQLIFDNRAADWVKQRLRDTATAHRLWCLGGGLAAVLGVLAATLAYMKIPRQSRGLGEDGTDAPS